MFYEFHVYMYIYYFEIAPTFDMGSLKRTIALIFIFIFPVLFSWLNTTMMENRVTLNPTDLDDFDKVKLATLMIVFISVCVYEEQISTI